ncbi:MAG: hypothetical protein H7Y31_03465, partial [Chitinophagaceae bacterium]|nr:hypothetical protein [Chitinophagaceae bacterium]
ISFPLNIAKLYEALYVQFKLKGSGANTTQGASTPLPDAQGIRKYLPVSYRTSFNFTNPRTEFAKTDDSYHCAIKRTGKPNPAFKQSQDDLTWGRVIAFCLRQPLLAKSIGLLHSVTIPLPAADYFKDGGWVYFNLVSDLAGFGITAANKDIELKMYAARIPAIDQPRQLFGALLFPVVPGPAQPNGQFDILKIEAADYDDGYAKIVHAVQPVSSNLLSEEPDELHVQKEMGIRLGWDDEQLLIWQNRQFLADPTTPSKRIDAPLGVFSYRVDVKEADKIEWNSLVNTRAKVDLVLGGELIAVAGSTVETGVQVFPSKINADADAQFWLPAFFTQWFGPSLVLPDARAAELDVTGALANPGIYEDLHKKKNPDQKSGLYESILPENCELKYGKEYDFRVRFADLTGGGPLVDEEALNDAPSKSASIIFKRYIAPKQLDIVPTDAQDNPDAGTNTFFTGNSFEVSRPRLGYPALLFTEMDTEDAFQKLVDDRDFLHTGKVGTELIKDQRPVGYPDPDVDSLLVVVELKTLLMDNLDSINQKESFLPLYQTTRKFPANPEVAYSFEVEYRNANVIDFGNKISLGDLNISQTELDEGDALVIPTSRDVRITIYPLCSDKPAFPEYFGFKQTTFSEKILRTGEPTQFFVRQNADTEVSFFKNTVESKRLQGIYLQPDPVQVVNKDSLVSTVVAGKESTQSSVMARLATQLGVDVKGLSLIGKPGERIQFACSNRIRHTLAPDNSSLTFATNAELYNHWLCVLSFEIDRDWTWDGLSEMGIEITRVKQFTREDDTLETQNVGYLQLKKTASRVAITKPDRSYTRVVFIDAVEPKKDSEKPATILNPFPNTIEVEYELKPMFLTGVNAADPDSQNIKADLRLPVTTIPVQVPKVVAAGVALSPYQAADDYSETVTRERCLWIEFEKPIEDPNDAYFARVLTYAPDPLLSFPNPDQLLLKQEDPPLATPVSLMRIITKDQTNDNAGIDDMQQMEMETSGPGVPLIQISPVHYILPWPKGLHAESPELFGFFGYELRVGHTDRIWSTAEGRWGHPTRLNSVQHPAPPLKCLVERNNNGIYLTAHYATAVFNGKTVVAKPPRTEIWCMLYAQVKQADGKKNRNILLGETMLEYRQKDDHIRLASFLEKRPFMSVVQANSMATTIDLPATGQGGWSDDDIDAMLKQFNLHGEVGLSVLAVEMMPRYDQFIYKPDFAVDFERPLSQGLGRYRILRTSRLVAAPEICCENCD